MKKNSSNNGSGQAGGKQRKKRVWPWVVILASLFAILSIVALGIVQYVGFVDIPIMGKALDLLGISRSGDEYKVETIDADSYFAENGKLLSAVPAPESPSVKTEAETVTELTSRGFDQFPVTSNYDMSGEFLNSAEASGSSPDKHPIYTTYYITENGDYWTIYQINGSIMAFPVSYNMESGSEVQVVISESEKIMSYDGNTNKFYETIPYETSLIVKVVERIDAATIESLTKGAIDEL